MQQTQKVTILETKCVCDNLVFGCGTLQIIYDSGQFRVPIVQLISRLRACLKEEEKQNKMCVKCVKRIRIPKERTLLSALVLKNPKHKQKKNLKDLYSS